LQSFRVNASGGGAPELYFISPALPNRLVLNTSTGEIFNSDVPTASGAETYTITAVNSGGSSTATVTIRVRASLGVPGFSQMIGVINAPIDESLAVASNPLIAYLGEQIVINPTISNNDGVTWSITPTPPSALVFSTSTGSITGVPRLWDYFGTTFTVTATNDFGSVQRVGR